MRNPVYLPQWMIVLTSVVVAAMSVASGETFPAFFSELHSGSASITPTRASGWMWSIVAAIDESPKHWTSSTIFCAITVPAMCVISILTLCDLLHELTTWLGDSGGEIDVICGYRTPWSNEFLRTRSPYAGAAQHSLHMQAEAIDIRLAGTPTAELHLCSPSPASRRRGLLSELRLRACRCWTCASLVVFLPKARIALAGVPQRVRGSVDAVNTSGAGQRFSANQWPGRPKSESPP
jgi:hypothetical protein